MSREAERLLGVLVSVAVVLGVALAAALWPSPSAAVGSSYLWALGDWTLLYAALPQTMFVLIYSRTPWFSHPIGRALMIKGLALALLLDWAFVVRVFGIDFPWSGMLRLSLFALIAAGASYQCWVATKTWWGSGVNRRSWRTPERME